MHQTVCGTANADEYDVFTLRLVSLFALRLAIQSGLTLHAVDLKVLNLHC